MEKKATEKRAKDKEWKAGKIRPRRKRSQSRGLEE
jgi:hypothetical protein